MSGARNPGRRSMSATEGAKAFGCTPRHIRRVIAEPRAEYLARMAERRAKVLALREQGLTYQQVGDELGIAKGTAYTIANHAKEIQKKQLAQEQAQAAG